MKFYWVEETKYGFISAVEEKESIVNLSLPSRRAVFPEGERKRTPLLKELLFHVKEYFNNGRFHDFSRYPVTLQGNPFSLKVYSFIRENLGWGIVMSYGEVAEAIGIPRAGRAVGNALSRNKTPILVPCHRVVGKRGPGGFSGGLFMKRLMLKIEGVKI